MKINRTILQALLSFVLGVSLGYADDAEHLLKHPGVTANRTNKSVVVDATATGLPANEAAEFVLINFKSGHDYESLAQTKALPSHIREALIFIGAEPSKPLGHSAMQIRSQGEEVEVLLDLDDEEIGMGDVLFDRRKDSTIKTNNFVFTGSLYTENPSDEGEQVLVADHYEPHSIIATFNTPATLLTVPWNANQGKEYGNIVPNPEYIFEEGDSLKFIFKPTGNSQEGVDLTLKVRTEGKGEQMETAYVLRSDKDEKLNKGSNIVGVLSEFGNLIDEGRKPDVSVHFDDQMKLGRIKRICAFLHSIKNEQGIMIKPPAEGQLYYQAFLPKPILYDRNMRPQQPPELHLEKENGEISAVLKQAEIKRDNEGSGEREVLLETQEIEGPSDFESTLDSMELNTPFLLVYVSEEFILADIMRYVQPVLESHPAVMVLTEKP